MLGQPHMVGISRDDWILRPIQCETYCSWHFPSCPSEKTKFCSVPRETRHRWNLEICIGVDELCQRRYGQNDPTTAFAPICPAKCLHSKLLLLQTDKVLVHAALELGQSPHPPFLPLRRINFTSGSSKLCLSLHRHLCRGVSTAPHVSWEVAGGLRRKHVSNFIE